MKADEPRREAETFADAARRLLAGLNERAKRPAVERTAEIQIDRTCPSSPVEKAAERLEGLQRSAAVIAANSGGSSGCGTENSNDNFASEVFSEPVGTGEADVRSLATSADSNIDTFTMPCVGNARWEIGK